ncbi:hypothetical protein D9758_014860 [Tetrapyrgos nigripes]|uniref:FAD-binding PCMH-type domain-containing protein n=1 Tax=Tetrapyrgos nigripes TaxID=182062 RepID=A0A8H5CTJ0_9AGAR|nr:hypothetical protein D9758_014860 [Tetrapyrgos nigripes]
MSTNRGTYRTNAPVTKSDMAPKTEPPIRMPFEVAKHTKIIFVIFSQAAAVQPGSVKDVRPIVNVPSVMEARSTYMMKVKGGGHGMAPGFSSTTSIQISMIRLSKIKYNPNTQLIEIGSGCLWDQVYSTLALTGYEAP